GDGKKIKRNKAFTVKVLSKNIEFGFFSNATNQYNVFPQELNENGHIQGHQHVSIQFLGKDKRSVKIPDATVFAFFKGLNDRGNGKGLLTTDVAIGLAKKGIYRICTLTASFSHQAPVLVCIRYNIVTTFLTK